MTDDLATRLKAATEGSRELSSLVLLKMGFTKKLGTYFSDGPQGPDRWYDIEGTRWKPAPDPARSVDDGLALAGDDWAAILSEAFDQLCELDQALGGDFTLARLPLFICAALVRAKEQETASE